MIEQLSNHTIEIPLFSAAIFPPVQLFTHLLASREALFEAYEHYQKKTYRNRYLIGSANGVLPLSVPVEKGDLPKLLMKDVRISYDMQWNEVHWRSIESAYNSSPYYLYYEDEIRAVFDKKWKYLLDMNLASMETIFSCLDIHFNIAKTTEYKPSSFYATDLRILTNPKNNLSDDNSFRIVEYRQVFASKFGFMPNLSILDLLFNKGPETLLVLKKHLEP
ncbi:MAG: WbqC family protein [Cytophagaceae bacterium]|jgi:hypothetical protein|nr:WbqC family protein [Cytophagaceae bacterium]